MQATIYNNSFIVTITIYISHTWMSIIAFPYRIQLLSAHTKFFWTGSSECINHHAFEACDISFSCRKCFSQYIRRKMYKHYCILKRYQILNFDQITLPFVFLQERKYKDFSHVVSCTQSGQRNVCFGSVCKKICHNKFHSQENFLPRKHFSWQEVSTFTANIVYNESLQSVQFVSYGNIFVT